MDNILRGLVLVGYSDMARARGVLEFTARLAPAMRAEGWKGLEGKNPRKKMKKETLAIEIEAETLEEQNR